MLKRLTLAAAVGLLATLACGPLRARAADDAFPPKDLDGVTDLEGKPAPRPFPAGAKAVVLVFLSVDCPVSNSYAPEYRRLAVEYGPKGAAFYGVYCDADADEATLRAHGRDYALPFLVLRDPRQRLARLAGATTTPEAAVFTPELGLAYHGRIDDRHVRLGLARPEAGRHDLRDALDQVLAGRRPASAFEPPVGCSLPRRP